MPNDTIMAMPDSKKLNKQQVEAIEHGEGPLLIIAGAGTGKTTVVTERVKWLIAEGKANPAEILALTFTEKAAREMEERIDVALPYGYTQMWTMTFHSFCDRVLRDDGIHIGINPGYKLITDTTATSLLRQHIFDLNLKYFRTLGNPNKFIAGLLQHFSRLKDEDVSPEPYSAWAKKFTGDEMEAEKYQELARVYQFYQDLKTKKGYMDFSDLICSALELFRNRPNVLAECQKRFKYILVDEYQDTNFAQTQLVNLLTGKFKNLTVVADDDQAIYRWRGAAISNVIQFRTTYPTAKLVVLTQNYRSTQEILDRSYDLIGHNNPDRLEVKENIDKKLVSTRKSSGEKIELLHLDRVENEAEAVAKKIATLKEKDPSLSYKDFAILVRANLHSEPFTASLSRLSIPYQFLGPGQLFHQSEVKDMIAYLRVLNDIGDDVSLFRILALDYFAIPGRDLAALGSFAKKYNLHLYEACELLAGKSLREVAEKPLVSQPALEKISQLVEIVNRHLDLLSRESAGQILFFFLQETGMLSAIMEYKLPLDEKRANNILKFFNKLKTFEVERGEATVAQTVEWIELSMELGESPLAADSDWTANDAVNIITIHSAKGLEFKVVFLVNLVSQRFPSIERHEQIPIPNEVIKEILPEGDFHLQEERRLFYVGMTRACDKLFFTAANFYGEGKREKKLSPFIAEALGDNFTSQTSEAVTQLSLLEWDKKPVEKAVAKDNLMTPISYLSYSQIQTFLDCPLHYKAKYILKIPSRPTASLSFGNCIHLTLKDFYSDPSQDILAIYKRNWIHQGYLNSVQEKEFKAKGERFLQQFLKEHYNSKLQPAVLEGMFTAPISLNGKMMKIGGKIDRVDVFPDGSIEIIDYKTGANSLTEKEANDNLQLSFYALAASLIKQSPYGRNPEDIKLTLFYFDENKKVTTTRTAEQLHQAVGQIFDIADKVSHSDFKCSGGMLCKSCEFKMLCDL